MFITPLGCCNKCE